MRLLGIVIFCASMISHGAPNKTDDKRSSGSRTSSVSLDAAETREALRIVIGLAKKFEAKYINILATDSIETFVYAPIIDFLVLSTFSLGTQGITRTRLEKALGFSNSESRVIRLGLRTLIDILGDKNEVGLRVSNKMYFPSRYSLNPEFANAMKNLYGMSIDDEDLSPSTKNKNVNFRAYVSILVSKLRQRLTHNGEHVYLTNAAYFKEQWKTEFRASRTAMRKFWKYGSELIDVPTMYASGEFRHGKIKRLDSSFIEIPYKSNDAGSGISMFVIRSDSQKGYELLFKEFGKIDVEELVKNSKTDAVDLYLPKFKIPMTVLSNEWIPQFFGTENPLEAKANLDGIMNKPGLIFQNIFSEIVMEVDEQGDAASATSAIYLKTRKARSLDKEEGKTFKVNRPFVAIVATTDTEMSIELFTMFVSGSELVSMQRNFQLAN